MRKIYLLLFIFSTTTITLKSQNAIMGPGFAGVWNDNCNELADPEFFIPGAGSSFRAELKAKDTGSRYFRFGVKWGNDPEIIKQLTINLENDVQITPNQLYSLDGTCTIGKAIYINAPNTTDNYIFKTFNGGTHPMGKFVVFRVQGEVQEVISVNRSHFFVEDGQSITVTADLSAPFSAGQGAYLRYTDDGWTSSTIVPMTGSGTTYTAEIPSSINTLDQNISYYVFTSGDGITDITHEYADLYTINYETNDGANFSYTVTSASNVVLFDDFNRGNSDVVGVPSSNPGGDPWTEYETNNINSAAKIKNQMLELSLGGVNGREIISYDMTGFYPIAFDEATDKLRWAFNWIHDRADGLGGFGTGSYGAAFILGCNKSNFTDNDAFGYAVIHGGSSEKRDSLRLVRFSGGIKGESSFKNILAHIHIGKNNNTYSSIVIEYNSISNEWNLYFRNDGTSFSSPIDGDYLLSDSGIDFEYTSTDLPYSGFLWNHGSTPSNIPRLLIDNFYIPSSSIPSDNEYVWVGGQNGSYTTPENWDPQRIHSRKRDRLVFEDGIYDIIGIPDDTIGQLILINSIVKLRNDSVKRSNIIVLTGGDGIDFFIDGESKLNLNTRSSTSNKQGFIIKMSSNTTGEIHGILEFDNDYDASGGQHQILIDDANALHIKNGGVVHAKKLANLTAFAPFGNSGSVDAVIFESGSRYIHETGTHAFGYKTDANKSKVVFEPGSWYEYLAENVPPLSNRKYANLKYHVSNPETIRNLSGSNPFFIDTLLVKNGTINISIENVGTIKGDIEVASGATLNFTPPSGKSSTIVLNSDVPQNIYGGGTLKFGNGATLKIQNEEKVSIQKNVTIEAGGKAIVEADGVIEFVNESYFDGGGETKIENNASIYIGSANGITSSGASGNVRTSTRHYPDTAAYIYNGTVNQVTGSGLPSKIKGTGSLEIANTGSEGSNTVKLTTDNFRTPKLTLTSGLFEVGIGQILEITAGGEIESTEGNFAAGNKAGAIKFMGSGNVNATGALDFYTVRLLKNSGTSNVSGVNFGNDGSPTIHDSLTINAGQWVQVNAPYYADGSTLFYNSGDNYIAGAEWYAEFTSGRGVPYNVLIGKKNKGTNLSFAGANRYLKNNLSIGGSDGTANSSLTLPNFSESYLEVGGDFIVNSKGSFNPNGARVIFSGSGDQTITSHATGNEVNFNYLTINKSGGDLILDDNPGTTVNVVANTNEVLVLTKGDIDLNGQTFKLGGNGGELKLEGSTGSSRSIKSNKAANFIFTGEKTVVSPSLELIFEDSVTVAITTSQSEPIGVDFGAGNPTRIEGTLRIDQNGFANVNAPFYGPQGILQYNINGPYKRRVEWHGKEGDPGFPNHVIVGGNTTLAAGGEGGEMVNEEFGARLDVIIEPGSSLYMDYDQHHMKVPLKVGRDLIIHGNLSASGAPGGDIHVAGNWIREVGGVFNPKERQVLFNGKTAQTITAPGTGETFDYLGFDSTGTKTLLSNIIVNKKLEIFGHSGAFKPGANVITLNGHWENSAGEEGFEHGTSTVVFKGDGEQKVKTSAAKENFYNVEIDNSSAKTEGVQLDSTDINIHGLLTLTEGLIHPDTNLVHFQNGSSTSEGNDVSYINGKARKTGFNSNDVINGFIFPVGYLKDTIDVFQPSGIIPESTSTTASFTVDYVHENYFPDTWVPNIPPPMGAGLATVSGCDYWNIERTVGGVDAKVRLYWSEACFDISEPNSLVVAKVEDGQWVNMGQSAVSPADFEDPYYRSGWVESSNVNNFSPFAIASSNPINVLPIELISFNAFAKGDKVETTWVTSTEKNNAYFTVEKSLDARHFVEVGRVEGAGNSTSQNSYALTDNRPYSGISYYRLKQTDFDGSHTYSEIRSVRIDRDSKFELVKIYRSDLGLNLAYRSEAEVLGVEIFDLVGKKIYHSQINNNNGFSTIHPNFARGIYLLRLSNGFETVTEKFFW